MNNNINNILDAFARLSLFERERFITRACAELINSMCEAREAKGLETIHKNLVVLTDFADAMQCELEIEVMRENIRTSFDALRSDFENDDFDDSLAEKLDALSDNIRQYNSIKISTEECDAAEEDAYDNIKALMDAEAAKVAEA